MTASNPLSQNIRAPGHDAATHLYKVGQTCHFKGGFGQRTKSSGLCRITGTLPPIAESPQYRIRNESEAYERVAMEDALEPISESDALAEATFGHDEQKRAAVADRRLSLKSKGGCSDRNS